jgi:hypothetical protein
VRILRYLEELLQKDVKSRVEFLKKLPTSLSLFNTQSIENKILPALLQQLQDPQLASFALPSVLAIAADASKPAFGSSIQPALARLMESSAPHPVTYLLLKSLQLLMTCFSAPAQEGCIVPMLVRALGSGDGHLIQQACLALVPVALDHKFTFTTLRTKLLPALGQLAFNPKVQVGMRVQALVCLGTQHINFLLTTYNQNFMNVNLVSVYFFMNYIASLPCFIGKVFPVLDSETVQSTVLGGIEHCVEVRGPTLSALLTSTCIRPLSPVLPTSALPAFTCLHLPLHSSAYLCPPLPSSACHTARQTNAVRQGSGRSNVLPRNIRGHVQAPRVRQLPLLCKCHSTCTIRHDSHKRFTLQ